MIDAVAYPVFVSIKTTSFKKIPHMINGNQLYLNIRQPEGTASWVFRFTLHGKRPWHGFGAYDSHHGYLLH